jgi:NTE family protein
MMASGAFPTAFDYEKIGGRGFWDGGILSNTPLRELIQKHRDYWHKDLGNKKCLIWNVHSKCVAIKRSN